mmetsp:Transcript_613/g.1784  ORF Transcript_613/g.1784 Transcript_613/m.1784 type:complete len:214 (+) Transcript_613:5011-5652(+)
MTSPGTSSLAGRSPTQLPSLRHWQDASFSSCKASKAFSAFDSCHTPTIAFRRRMRTMTPGSTKAFRESIESKLQMFASGWTSFIASSSSLIARTKLTIAATKRTLTSVSSNCSRTSFQIGVDGGFSNSFSPCFSLLSLTWSELNPWAKASLAWSKPPFRSSFRYANTTVSSSHSHAAAGTFPASFTITSDQKNLANKSKRPRVIDTSRKDQGS